MGTQARIVALLMGLALADHAAADAYAWTDEEGTVHYEQAPPGKQRARRIPLQSENALPGVITPPAAAAGAADARSRTGPARREATPKPAPQVELFTTSWCPWCKKAREWFRGRGLSFTEHDIEKDEGALERKLGLDGDKHVPTAIIGGKVVKGYSPARYQAALDGR